MSKVVSKESSPSFCTITSTFNFLLDPSRKDSESLKSKNKNVYKNHSKELYQCDPYGVAISRRFGMQILSPPQFFCILIESLETANSSLSRSITGVRVLVNFLFSSIILYLNSASNGVNLSLTLF